MQIMAVVGKPPPKAVTRGDLWPHEEIQMLDPRDYDSRDRNASSRDVGRGGRAPGARRERASNNPRDVFMRDLDQVQERWPRELFVSLDLAREALDFFLEAGKQKPTLHWVRTGGIPRETVWEGREGREAWLKKQRTDLPE
jgi:hypothetical protein